MRNGTDAPARQAGGASAFGGGTGTHQPTQHEAGTPRGNNVHTGQEIIWRFWLTEDRYYTITLQNDLEGLPCVMQAWGSRHSHRGSSRSHQFQSVTEAMRHIENIEKRRIAHHYKLLDL